MPGHTNNPPTRATLDAAKEHVLRLWCDLYFPQLVDLAENGNSFAIDLLVFSGRKELQTPAPSELRLPDFWAAMRELESVVDADMNKPTA